MKTLLIGAAIALAASAAAAAQTSPPKPTAPPAAPPPAAVAAVPLPRAMTGYAQPEITNCKVVNPNTATCTIPAMTAGRYVITASGTSTATADGAAQAVQIAVGTRICGRADRRGNPQSPWATGAQTLKVACDVMILTDRPLTVTIAYADDKATKDPKGPTVKIEKAPWDGIMSAQFNLVR